METNLKEPYQKLLILYGSQTGTAQETAERIWRESKNYGFNGPISSMDDYNISKLISEPLVILVCSTTGQGDQPDNMKKFWKFLLRKSLPQNSLQNTSFAVLGLGDSSYVKFNFVAKKLFRRLETLGGTALCDVGLADDQHDVGVDAVIEPWLNSLWTKLIKMYCLNENIKINKKKTLPLPRWKVSVVESSKDILENVSETITRTNIQIENTIETNVISNERLTPETHFQDVRHIKLNLPSSVSYEPGDVVYTYPHNRLSSINKCLELLGERTHPLLPQMKLKLEQSNEFMPVPYSLKQILTIENLCTYYWDLNATPKRYIFELLYYFTTNELEKEKLEEFISAEGQTELYNYANKPKRTILEVLSDFPHACSNIPIQYLFEIFTPIRPRAFSIASSPKAHSNELHMLVAVVKYRTKMFSPRYGLCSNYLSNLKPNDRVVISIKNGSFIFPKNPDAPIVMIGPGTGVAPFRSYIHTRVEEKTANSKKLILYFGCRNKNSDFYFNKEWEILQTEKQLEMFTAFSRDQKNKIYVQHKMEENLSLLKSFLLEGGYVYIAGNANGMPDAVKDVLVQAINTHYNDEEMAKTFLQKMELTAKLQTETWA